MRRFRLTTGVRLSVETSGALDEFRGRPVFLVTDDFLVTTDVHRKVVDRLDERVTAFTGVEPDPSTFEIGVGVSVYLQFGPDVVIAYDGGPVMDATKVVHKAALDASLGVPEGVVAIPTTSGSGLEVTSFAVVIDEQTHMRIPIAFSELVVGLAILDPEVVVGVSLHIAADSSMDMLIHTMEVYMALEVCDSSDALAEKAIGLVSGNLERCYTHGDDPEARSHVHNASCMAAMAFDNVGLSIIRSLARTLDGHYPIAYERLNALPLPYAIEFNTTRSDRTAERCARLNRLLRPLARGRAAVMSLIGVVEQLRSRLGVPSWLNDLGVASEVLRRGEDDLVAAALVNDCIMTTPVTPSPDDLKGILCRIA